MKKRGVFVDALHNFCGKIRISNAFQFLCLYFLDNERKSVFWNVLHH